MPKIRHFFAVIFGFLLNISNDLLVLAGIVVIIWTNFRVNEYFGLYSLGITFVLAGLGLTRLLRKAAK